VLKDAQLSGNPLGTNLVKQVSVANGLFSAALDYGAAAFPGDQRWLEISVRTNGASLFSPLSPTQPVSPNPYAIMSAGIALGAVGNGQLAPNAVSFDKIQAEAVGNSQLAPNAVSFDKIQAGAVGNGQLATNAVSSDKIQTGAVGNGQLANDAGL